MNNTATYNPWADRSGSLVASRGAAPAPLSLVRDGNTHLGRLDAGAANIFPRVTRDMAMAVPAVAQAAQIVGLLATMPLMAIDETDTPVPNPPDIIRQPDDHTAAVTTFQDTYADMMLYGAAYWLVTRWQGRRDAKTRTRPAYARHIPAGHVTLNDDGLTAEYDSKKYDIITPARRAGRHALIKFDGPLAGGLLAPERAHIVRTAYTLEIIAGQYASPDIPTGYLEESPQSQPLTREQREELLTAWEESRQRRNTAYLGGGLTFKTTRIMPAELQLIEAREMSDARIAQAVNMPPSALNARAASDSRTYTNLEQSRRDLLDLSLSAYREPLVQRLSMDDITPRGTTIRANMTEFLRADLPTMVQLGTQGVAAGLFSVEEWRHWAGLTREANYG